MKDSDLKALTGLCAKCGTCRTVCTLYPERKAEIAVARGKVALIEAALSGEDGNAEAMQEALTDCLLCGRCERACPNQVLVEEIVMKGRADLAEKVGIPAWKSVLFGRVMKSPGAAGIARKAAAAGQRLLPGKISTASGLHYRFPDGLGGKRRTVPKLPARGFIESLGKEEASFGEVMLFVGCVFDHVFPRVGRTAYETVKAAQPDCLVVVHANHAAGITGAPG